MNRILYWYWLSSLQAVGAAKRRKLLRLYGHPRALFHERNIPWRCLPDFSEAEQRAFLESRSQARLETEYDNMRQKGITYISSEDEAYPPLLKQIYDPPFGLFCIGDTVLLSKPAVAVIGARKCSHYGASCAAAVAQYLAAAGVTVVSGMARGVDAHAHHGALRAAAAATAPNPVPAACQSFGVLQSGGRPCSANTLAVLGSGVNVCYPNENAALYRSLREHALLLSENPPDTPALPYFFPLRNRIISGLSRAVIVIEAKRKSGSLITADFALEQGREVFAVPGRIYDPLSEGCNRLIGEGASPLLHPGDALKCLPDKMDLTGILKQNKKKTLEKREILLYSCLDYEPLHINELSRRAGMPVSHISVILMQLEKKELISQPVRNYYMKQLEF